VSLVFAPGTSLAPLGWVDAEYAALIKKADAITNIDEAAATYAQADARLAEQAPVAFLYHPEVLTLLKPYVKGRVGLPGDPAGFIRSSNALYVTNDK